MTHSPSNPPSSDAGLLLRRHRREAGLTQEELAERAGISPRTVSDIERGIRTSIYRDTADRLAAGLGLDPRQRDELIGASRRAPERPAQLGHLPAVPPTPLFGRERELGRLAALVEGGARLVTLTGPPGVGKSRLALEAAHSLAARRSGAWYISLAPVGAPEGVPSAVLRGLELPDVGEGVDRVAQRLPPGSLLVLDNFEHVLEAAPWLGELLQASPSLVVLATSRAPLRLRAEREFPLLPLEEDAALHLFRERTSAVRLDQPWDERELELARRICTRLDGIPLALELGAAATAYLSLAGLADGLDARLDILGEGWRDMPARHRSMQAAVAWSLDLLAPPDREVMEAVSVFAGTFGIEAVAAVAAREEAVAVHRLRRLVEQSLVRMADEVNGQPRYQVLEVVRQTAGREAAAAGRLDGYRSRHLDHFLQLAEAAEPHMHGFARNEWSDRMAAEMDNVDAALDHAEASGDTDRGLRLATALWRWWRQRGVINPGRSRFRRLLEMAQGSPEVRARALWGASWLALHQQDKEDARRWSEELLRLADATGGKLARRNALTGLGMVARFEGREEESLPLFREAESLARGAGDPWILATSIFNVGQPLQALGRLPEAEQAFEDARGRYLALGDLAFAARMRLYQAMGALLSGDTARARIAVAEAAGVFTGLGEPWGQVECLEIGAATLALLRQDAAAASALGAAAAAHQVLGSAQLGPDRALMAPFLEDARARARDGWAKAMAAGSDLDLEEAVSNLLGDLALSGSVRSGSPAGG